MARLTSGDSERLSHKDSQIHESCLNSIIILNLNDGVIWVGVLVGSMHGMDSGHTQLQYIIKCREMMDTERERERYIYVCSERDRDQEVL